ncbi:MAG TPA: hypothetical protein VKU38_22620, partial [Ktedonobacteraceae bacterium]|nr:hypothetical protein [Ktedonobacteraceae bacterium]
LDNQQASLEFAKTGRTRRFTEHVVLSAMRTWLLQDYVLPYCRTLAASRIYRRCYWIDAWGGDTRTFVAGTENGAQPQPAKGRKKEIAAALPAVLQPVVALSAELAQEQRPIALNGIMLVPVSGMHSRRKTAANNTDTVLTVPKESGLMRGDWLEAAPVLLKTIESSPAIFLLNPFGTTLFTHDALTSLYQRTTAPTEVCLLIPHKSAELRLLAAARTAEGAAHLTLLLRSDRWKGLLSQHEENKGNGAKEGKETTPFIDSFIELYVAAMQRHFLTVQRLVFPVVAGPASIETVPYSLLFATRSKESLLRMNDAVCLYRRRIMEERYKGTLNETWFVQQHQERLAEEQQELYQHVLQQGRSQRTRRWPDLRQQLLLAQFGSYPVREYDATISKLIADGMVRCEWKRPLSGEAEMRVPENEDMLLWR